MQDRRGLLVSSLALAAVAAAARAQPTTMAPGQGAMSMQACIDACLATDRLCIETSRHSREKGGAHAAPGHIAILLDCADLCQATATSMMRGSPIHTVLCEACAKACEACSKDCAGFDDVRMQRCAASCRDCAASCAMMAMTSR